jgi:hypothetical protein
LENAVASAIRVCATGKMHIASNVFFTELLCILSVQEKAPRCIGHQENLALARWTISDPVATWPVLDKVDRVTTANSYEIPNHPTVGEE